MFLKLHEDLIVNIEKVESIYKDSISFNEVFLIQVGGRVIETDKDSYNKLRDYIKRSGKLDLG